MATFVVVTWRQLWRTVLPLFRGLWLIVVSCVCNDQRGFGTMGLGMGGGGAWSPPQFRERGVAERGSKGHTLISSIQISEIFGSNLLMGGGGGRDAPERLTTTG